MLDLWLPILISTVALFFASFLSWMVVKLHEKDWVKMEGEDNVIDAVREAAVPEGNYMFPGSLIAAAIFAALWPAAGA